MNITGVFFDLDDTLHDHQKPFIDAFTAVFPDYGKILPLDTVYKRFREVGDFLWPKLINKELSLYEYRIQRTIQTLQAFQINISKEQAAKFQQQYEFCLNHLELFPEAPEVLDTLSSRGYRLGMITNGPTEHQKNKLRALGITKYIPKEAIFISEEVGAAKPNPQIFQYAAQKVNQSPENLLYIGDTWANDIVGAYKAGWQAIWFNHRKRQPGTEYTPFAEVDTLSSVLELLK